MPKRNLLILEKAGSPWIDYLEEFFDDTSSQLFFFDNAHAAGQKFENAVFDMAFLNPGMLSLPLIQKLKVARASTGHFRIVRLGKPSGKLSNLVYDAAFDEKIPWLDFQKQLMNCLLFPETVQILVVDDEIEICNMVRDYLEGRSQPAFEIDYAENGELGLRALARKKPDVLVLDIKMPVLDGREVYRTIQKQRLEIPVIIFFDAVFGDEIEAIRKIGKPAVVEKGSHQSRMAELLMLIKKLVYFG
ncbi:MAG: response regulator [Candidatus Omnitrophica bacterium]|nr:response regulator [Candidatus Omnitrophota bacterium]MDD5671279.1 response regulator [Candidatus Omnitrophota bacterium]